MPKLLFFGILISIQALVKVDNWQFGKVEFKDVGKFIVWCWVERGAEGTLEVGDAKFNVVAPKMEKDKKNESGYSWVKVGDYEVKKGGYIRVWGFPKIARVLFVSSTEYSPEKAGKYGQVLREPDYVKDKRVEELRDTNTIFSMRNFDSLSFWEEFADRLRRTISVGCGLFPEREKCPLNPHIFDRYEGDGFTVEKVYFESEPGFYVTGNLYKPSIPGKHPGVLCPHGHWSKGRLEHSERASVPARCITLARMGCVVFSYDMVGYNDSQQLPHNWGSNKLKLWGLHPCSVQLWNSIRALDFLQTLPEVDPEKIACTGASGGGTQTFLLCAVDSRVKVSAPVNMISCSMQGGCICENAPLIRIFASNMEIGSLMAPRPMILISATGDWTWATPRVEFPAIRSVYELYSEEKNIETVQFQAEHNYNKDSREAMYRFFGKYFFPERDWSNFKEGEISIPPESALRVFTEKQIDNLKKDGYDVVLGRLLEGRRLARSKHLNIENGGEVRFRNRDGLSLAIAMGMEPHYLGKDVSGECLAMDREPDYVIERWILSRRGVGDRVPLLLYRGYEGERQKVVLLVHDVGKDYFIDSTSGELRREIKELLLKGYAVAMVDLFLTGEHKSPWFEVKRRQTNYFDTFHSTRTAEQVKDIITALFWLSSRRDLQSPVALAGCGKAGVLVLFAGAICKVANPVIADLANLDLTDDSVWEENYYIPSIRIIGDISNAVMWILPERRCVVGNVHPSIVFPLKVEIISEVFGIETLPSLL
ncbi:MAG: acetylxylan esterase [Candidatus Hydrogenedentes bacterium]|nr:acetylxylan esterase [Candidatus Hydrogenedentota bacterium]